MSRFAHKLLLSELTADRAARVAFLVATSACWRRERARSARGRRPGQAVGPPARDQAAGTPARRPDRQPGAAGLARVRPKVRGGQGWIAVSRLGKRASGSTRRLRPGKNPVCSPNDLRRTFAAWMRAAGAPPDLIAPMMGHADTRMVERVYGPVRDLAVRVAKSIGADCSAFVADAPKLGGSPNGLQRLELA
jgi:integrase